MSQALAVIQQLFRAVKVWDVEGLLACYDPAVVITEAAALPYGGTYTGLDGARRHAREFARTWHPWLADPADQRPVFAPPAPAPSWCASATRPGMPAPGRC